MSDSALQGFIDGLASRAHPRGWTYEGGPLRGTRLDERVYGWRNVPTPVAFRQRARPVMLGLQQATSENIRKINLELFVGLFRYKHIIKRLRELLLPKVRRRRYLTFAERWWAPPRSAAGGRHGGQGYIDTREHYNYNQGNNMVTRHQKRKWDDTAWYDRKWGD